MKIVACAILTLVFAGLVAAAQQAALAPGEYLDGNGGFLLIKPGSGGNLAFQIESFGMNRHSCSVNGTIGRNNQAVLKPEPNETCLVSFIPKADGIEVALKEPCRGYCGARATFDGMYLRPKAGCDRAGVRKARAEFKRLYDKKAYGDARTTLDPVLNRCSKTLENTEEAWIRNDLALTQLRLGDAAACRKTLEPIAELGTKSEKQIREDMPPADADSMVRVARATQTNLKLCK
jgi:hypothetical protein